MNRPRTLVPLSRADAIGLLASVPIGRIVFTQQALPAIRPVNHLVDDGSVVIRTHLGAAVLSAVGEVVAYEADAIDPDRRVGWSVVVTGVARLVHDPAERARYERLLRPWMAGPMDRVIRIRPELVTGTRLVSEADVGEADTPPDGAITPEGVTQWSGA